VRAVFIIKNRRTKTKVALPEKCIGGKSSPSTKKRGRCGGKKADKGKGSSIFAGRSFGKKEGTKTRFINGGTEKKKILLPLEEREQKEEKPLN